MNCEERKNKILGLRKRDIVGKCVILRPASEKYSACIANLRNKPKNIYWFNQNYNITEESQNQWFKSYENTDNDIYWCVLNKNEKFVGTIRLYGIDLNGERCEEGSYVIDDDVTKDAPYAIESKMLALDIAFDELEIKTMINDNRADNKVMNNLDNKLGFDKGEIIQIRSVDYLHRTLTAGNYRKNRAKFSSVIDYWSER